MFPTYTILHLVAYRIAYATPDQEVGFWVGSKCVMLIEMLNNNTEFESWGLWAEHVVIDRFSGSPTDTFTLPN